MDFKKKLDEKLQETLQTTVFYIAATISQKWLDNAQKALSFASILSLGINPEDWMKLVKLDVSVLEEQLTLMQFATLSNNLQNCTPDQLGLSNEEYGELMFEADTYVKSWQEITGRIKDDIIKDLTTEMQAEKPTGNLKKA